MVMAKKVEKGNLEELAESSSKTTQSVEEDEDGIKVKVETKEEEVNDGFDVINEDSGLRHYELTITYDFYYLTPRLWMSGYSE